MERQLELLNERPTALTNSQWQEYIPISGITLLDQSHFAEAAARGGNILAGKGEQNSYFDHMLKAEYSSLEREALYKILDEELPTTGSEDTGYGGIHHCLLPSPKHVIIRRNRDETFNFEVFGEEQNSKQVLKILGY